MTMSEKQPKKTLDKPGAVYTIPNALSIMRGALGPLVAYLIILNEPHLLVAALGLMLLAELSDYLDGLLARKFGQESELGRVIDPICDSIYHLSVFMAFLSNGWLAAWMLFVIYARDLSLPYIRSFARQVGKDIAVRDSGKIKTATHAVCQICIMLLAIDAGAVAGVYRDGLLVFFGLLAVTSSVYSLWDYVSYTFRDTR